MTINTMQELEAVPLDSTVTVDNMSWTRTATGLTRLDVDLPLSYFEGRVLRGAVVNPNLGPPEPGQWWRGRTRIYYISRVDSEFVYYIVFRDGRLMNSSGSSRLATWTSSTVRRLNDPTEALGIGLVGLAPVLADAQAEVRRAREEVETARAEVEAAQATVSRANNKPGEVRQAVIDLRNDLDRIVQLIEE